MTAVTLPSELSTPVVGESMKKVRKTALKLESSEKVSKPKKLSAKAAHLAKVVAEVLTEAQASTPIEAPVPEVSMPQKAVSSETVSDKKLSEMVETLSDIFLEALEAERTASRESALHPSHFEPEVKILRGRGRPLGCKDSVKRHKKGELNKPPVVHGALGRPLGSKDKAPRRKRVTEGPTEMDVSGEIV